MRPALRPCWALHGEEYVVPRRPSASWRILACRLGAAVDEVKVFSHHPFDDKRQPVGGKAEADITRSAAKARAVHAVASSGSRTGAFANPLAEG